MRLRYFLLALAFIGLTTWLGFIGPHSTAAPASTRDNRLPLQEAASTLTKPEHHAGISTAAPVQTGKNAAPFSTSTNGGSTWNSSASGLSGANVRSLVISPTAPATIYAATEYGVFKSLDGGGNWSATGLVTFIEVLAIDPVTTTTVYAGGPGGVYKTTDAGINWSAINNGLVSNSFIPFVTAVVIDPTNAATLYAGTSSGGGVFKSTDGGSNWSAVNNGLTVTAGTATFVPTVNTLALDQ